MHSKTSKLRDQLANVAIEREIFEKQRKELENQMTTRKSNMDKIQKSLKGKNDISSVLISELEIDEVTTGTITASKRNLNNYSGNGLSQGKISRNPSNTVKNNNLNNLNGNGNDGSNLSPMKSFSLAMNRNISTASSSVNGENYNLGDGNSNISAIRFMMRQNVIMPTYNRVSDWCFTGPLDTYPPAVKQSNIQSIYEFVRWIGRGSFGDVQLIKSIKEKQLFAMKTIFSEHQSEMTKSLREVTFLRTYRHPYIIDILDSYCTSQPKILYIVMHYCEGGDLGKLISSAKKNGTTINEYQIIKWSIQLALALHFLHENHILHRDLKPSNALLTDGGETVKLADFGLTTELINNVCSSGAEAGTPLYTAPEMIHGEKYSYPTDCWSFGVMLHELLNFEPPFCKGDTTELVKSILNDEPPELPSHYSSELRVICKLFLVKNPVHRLGFAAMLCDPFLASKVQSFPSSYRPKSLEERIRRAHVKQLQAQIEALQQNASLISNSTPIAELQQIIENQEKIVQNTNLLGTSSNSIDNSGLNAQGSAVEGSEVADSTGRGPIRGVSSSTPRSRQSKRHNQLEKNQTNSQSRSNQNIKLVEGSSVEEASFEDSGAEAIAVMGAQLEGVLRGVGGSAAMPDLSEDTADSEMEEQLDVHEGDGLPVDMFPSASAIHFDAMMITEERAGMTIEEGDGEEEEDEISSLPPSASGSIKPGGPSIAATATSGGRIGQAIAEAQAIDSQVNQNDSSSLH